MPDLHLKIGFIGAGNMGQAMIGALIASGCCAGSDIFVCDVIKNQTDRLKATYNISVSAENKKLVEICDVIIFAVKPQSIVSVLSDLKENNAFLPVNRKKIFISIAAGIPIKTFESYIYDGKDASRKKRSSPPRPSVSTSRGPATATRGVVWS